MDNLKDSPRELENLGSETKLYEARSGNQNHSRSYPREQHGGDTTASMT